MDVGVTVSAMSAGIVKDKTGMALRAGDVFMQAPQRIASSIVIELRNRTNRLPAGPGMAVLAGNGEGPVRIGHFCSRRVVGLPCAFLFGRHAKGKAE